MLSNTKITRDHKKSVFPGCRSSCYLPSLSQDPDYPPMQVAVTNGSSVQQKLRMRRLHHEFENDYIFEFATEVNEENTNEYDDLPEETYMTISVKTSSRKTISIKCDKNR